MTVRAGVSGVAAPVTSKRASSLDRGPSAVWCFPHDRVGAGEASDVQRPRPCHGGLGGMTVGVAGLIMFPSARHGRRGRPRPCWPGPGKPLGLLASLLPSMPGGPERKLAARSQRDLALAPAGHPRYGPASDQRPGSTWTRLACDAGTGWCAGARRASLAVRGRALVFAGQQRGACWPFSTTTLEGRRAGCMLGRGVLLAGSSGADLIPDIQVETRQDGGWPISPAAMCPCPRTMGKITLRPNREVGRKV